MKSYIIIIYILLGIMPLYAQQNKKVDLTNRLTIGSTVPDLPVMDILNFPSSTIDLDDYKDKVLILDFWDTFCSTCIELMPHVKEVQKTIGDKAQIITVTWQSKEVIDQFFKGNKYLKEHQAYLPTIIADYLLKSYFPHQGVPHTVFIYKGKVKAITYFDYIKPEYIDKLIAEDKLDIPVKDDFNTKGVIPDQQNLNLKGKVLITGYQDGLEFKGGLPIEKDSVTGMFVTSMINTGILDAFMRLHAFIEPPTYLWIPARIEWHVKDQNIYKYKSNTTGPRIWDTKNAICYQRFSQDSVSKKEMAKLVMQDLVSFLGVSVTIEKKEKDVVVIRKTTKSRAGAIKPESKSQVEGADNLAFLLDQTEKYPPAFDESGFTEIIDIPDFSSLEKLNQQLLYYGLEASIAPRIIDVVVVREQNKK
ncbi:TlpA family protein disulfide reductase [Sphingobacterium faecium]|uniref:TlpA family protein disulfide reductase n=1 Tax=Sphingobacterium faecium TaxID=34087 RepID=UPI0032089516